jgi:Domain of unknown function (DUF4287)
MALHPHEMNAAIIANLPAKTGFDLAHWVAVVKSAGPFSTKKLATDWLKVSHNLGHITAQLIVRHANEEAYEPSIEKLFAASSPIVLDWLSKIIGRAKAAQLDLVVTPCETYVGLGAPVQFAALAPLGTNALVLGLTATDPVLPSLASAKGFGGSDRIAHKLIVNSQAMLDQACLQIGYAALDI